VVEGRATLQSSSVFATSTARVWLGLLCACAFVAGCTAIKAFKCAADIDCGDAKTCQVATGFCSIADGECPTGHRFDDSAGDGLAGQCVSTANIDGGPFDATIADAMAPDADPDTFIYVDGIGGSDFNTGEEGSPFKSITKAVGEVQPNGVIFVAPGLYDAANNETFPITLPAGVALVGDEGSKGDGATATEIVGDGFIEDSEHAAIILSEGSQVLGFKFSVGSTLVTCGASSWDVTAHIRDNTFAAGYCGVRLIGTGETLVRNNVFRTTSYGVYGSPFGGAPTIDFNLFEGPNNPIYLYTNAAGTAVIKGNTINGGASTGIALYNGDHRVEDNVITKAGSYNNGCIRFQKDNSVVRNNTCNVQSGPGFVIENDAAPHCGVYNDPGNNVFYSTPGISHRGTATVPATGNKWRQVYLVPECGTDIETTSTGTVEYGTQSSPASCP
jgi:hypothetical protein